MKSLRVSVELHHQIHMIPIGSIQRRAISAVFDSWTLDDVLEPHMAVLSAYRLCLLCCKTVADRLLVCIASHIRDVRYRRVKSRYLGQDKTYCRGLGRCCRSDKLCQWAMKLIPPESAKKIPSCHYQLEFVPIWLFDLKKETEKIYHQRQYIEAYLKSGFSCSHLGSYCWVIQYIIGIKYMTIEMFNFVMSWCWLFLSIPADDVEQLCGISINDHLTLLGRGNITLMLSIANSTYSMGLVVQPNTVCSRRKQHGLIFRRFFLHNESDLFSR